MGTNFDKCIFTSLPTYLIHATDGTIIYRIEVSAQYVFIKVPYNSLSWEENDFFKENKHLFESLLLNNNWFDDQTTLITLDKLRQLLFQKKYPHTPKEKADNLFEHLIGLQKEDGQEVFMDWTHLSTFLWKKLYFKSLNELKYYFSHLEKIGLLNLSYKRDYDVGLDRISSFLVTFNGLDYGIQLQSEGEHSNLCFIAMSFRNETQEIRVAIKEALVETGFKPIIIDEQNINSDRTINDEIIANLKKCKFCIADFSYHSNGVYFESGFALGQGKKVIYTCSEQEFQNAHFDIRPLQHIIYKTTDQLKKDLINKIEAWIK